MVLISHHEKKKWNAKFLSVNVRKLQKCSSLSSVRYKLPRKYYIPNASTRTFQMHVFASDKQSRVSKGRNHEMNSVKFVSQRQSRLTTN